MAIRKSFMSGGTTCWIYGGGEKGNVTGTSKLTISNTAAITENIFGGSDSGTCGNTEVNVSGGTFAYGIYGGCFTGQVTGFSKVIVTGGNFFRYDLRRGIWEKMWARR